MDIDIGNVIAIVAAVVAIIASLRAARKDDVEALSLIVERVQEENARLADRQKKIDTENEELRSRVKELEAENKDLKNRFIELRQRYEALLDWIRQQGLKPPEEVEDDESKPSDDSAQV